LPFCIFKFVIRQYKSDEFVKSINSYVAKIRKQKDCLSYSLYLNSEMVLWTGRQVEARGMYNSMTICFHERFTLFNAQSEP
jgi:quinol monooxygenase YgiN